MKVISVVGNQTKAGKTTVIEHLIKELKRRGYTVGTVKEIHFEGFQMDTEGKNTFRHRKAGAGTVTARGHNETDVLYEGHLPIYDILAHYHEDFVLMEGVRDALVPEIVVATEDGEPKLSDLSIAVSGRYANLGGREYLGLPVFHCERDMVALADLVEAKTPHLFPNVLPECCSQCGGTCKELLVGVLNGTKSEDACVLRRAEVVLKIGGKELVMVPFVQQILKNNVLAIAKELNGYQSGQEIALWVREKK